MYIIRKNIFTIAHLFIITLLIPLEVNSSQDGVQELCKEISYKLNSIRNSDCLKVDFQSSDYKTNEGRALIYKEVNPNIKNKPPNGKVLFIGGIHGDEYASISTTYLWLRFILNSSIKNPYQWLFLPLANPDGLMNSTRQNGRGVDINRNFDTPNWSDLALFNWEKKYNKDPRRYPGSYSASEIETLWIQNIIQRYQPDVIISVHTPYSLLDYDGPEHAQPNSIGSLKLRPLGTYPGSLGRYSGETLKIPTSTVELNKTNKLSSSSELKFMWKDLELWIAQKIKHRELDF